MQGSRLSKGIWKPSSCQHCCAPPKPGWLVKYNSFSYSHWNLLQIGMLLVLHTAEKRGKRNKSMNFHNKLCIYTRLNLLAFRFPCYLVARIWDLKVPYFASSLAILLFYGVVWDSRKSSSNNNLGRQVNCPSLLVTFPKRKRSDFFHQCFCRYVHVEYRFMKKNCFFHQWLCPVCALWI